MGTMTLPARLEPRDDQLPRGPGLVAIGGGEGRPRGGSLETVRANTGGIERGGRGRLVLKTPA